ncbi:hypothetical protein [Neorhizobium tomejilense]|uniref:ATP dependent DNA ligase n=1 Tax=Neorhizobium tomejilense TaxID=2093828 RepID=UPI003F50168A
MDCVARCDRQPAAGRAVPERLQYLGSFGTGFRYDVARSLKKQLDKLKTTLTPVSVPGKDLVLTAPALVAETEYRAWTNDGKLQHPSFKGLRDADNAFEIHRLPD